MTFDSVFTICPFEDTAHTSLILTSEQKKPGSQPRSAAASESTAYTLRIPERLCSHPSLSYVGHCWDCALLELCSLKKKDALNADLGPNQHELEPTGGRKAVKSAGRGVGSSCSVASLGQVRVEGWSGISTTYLLVWTCWVL